MKVWDHILGANSDALLRYNRVQQPKFELSCKKQ